MPLSAYPKGYELGKDNQSWLMRLKFKYFQVPLTGGPRVPKGFWKFREFPKVLFSFKGRGHWRYENTDGKYAGTQQELIWVGAREYKRSYLSRIQPWCRFHFALMWPLGFTFHIFWRQQDVEKYPTYRSDFGIKKMLAGYLGWIRDSDKIYKPKAYLGGNFE